MAVVVSTVIASACSQTERREVTLMPAPAPVVVPPEARRPCVLAPKPVVDPATNTAPEDQVFEMSATDRFAIKSCDRRRAAAVAAIDAANGAAP